MSSYFFSEWLLDTRVEEIPFHWYTVPLKNLGEAEVEAETATIVRQLRRNHPGWAIASAGHLIGAFQPVASDEIQLQGEQKRDINPSIPLERRLLERLLSRSFELSQNRADYLASYGKVIPRKPTQVVGGIEIRRYLQFDMNVDESGRITVGFELSHQYSHVQNIEEMLRRAPGKIEPKCLVVNRVDHQTYWYVRQLESSIVDPILPNGQSLKEYHIANGRESWVHSLPDHTPAVECLNHKDKPLSFVPQFLKLVSSFDQVPAPAQKVSKLAPSKRVQTMFLTAEDHLQQWKQKAEFPLSFDRWGLDAKKKGYVPLTLTDPLLVFGKGRKDRNPYRGLSAGGIHETPKSSLACQYLLDDDILRKVLAGEKGKRILPIEKELSKRSAQLGVPLTLKGPVHRIQFSDSQKTRVKLMELSEQVAPGCPLIVVADRKNLSKGLYGLLKQVLGKDYAVSTQVVTMDTLELQKGRSTALLNLLLGVYVKSGIQPWVLSEPLYSPCFIGLDVSREDGKHGAGVVQTIGTDGRVLWSKPVTSVEAGEKIGPETLEKIVAETVFRFRKRYRRVPDHITFHRDGKGHWEEIEALNRIAESHGIKFDYISLVKKAGRRMAMREEKQGAWKNPMGVALLKGDTAYLCATDPADFLGMAQPVRIQQRTGTLKMEEIVEDIFKLSYMNVHAINKSRLPVTVNYADKSSTFFNRGMLPTHVEMPVQSV